MKEPKNTKSISELEEDILENYLKTLTIGQAYELLDLGITLDIDYKNKKVLSVII